MAAVTIRQTQLRHCHLMYSILSFRFLSFLVRTFASSSSVELKLFFTFVNLFTCLLFNVLIYDTLYSWISYREMCVTQKTTPIFDSD